MITRRAFVGAGALVAAALLAGCGQGGQGKPAGGSSESDAPEPKAGNVLVAWFSRAGENYGPEGIVWLEEGNTKVMADYLLEALGADAYEIVPEEPYPTGYDECLDRASVEQTNDARPAIANPLPDMTPYDVVLLGCPIWWGAEPMIVRTFLDGVDLAGKTVIPFTTSGGSGLGEAPEDEQALEPDATFLDGFTVRGTDVGEAHDEVTEWATGLGLD